MWQEGQSTQESMSKRLTADNDRHSEKIWVRLWHDVKVQAELVLLISIKHQLPTVHKIGPPIRFIR